MSDSYTLIESERRVFDLSGAQVAELQRLRVALQGSQAWWGASRDEEPGLASPIQLSPRGQGQYEITIRDAVGALALPDMQLVVIPKIRHEHFLYIAARAFGDSRADATTLALKTGEAFKDLVCSWFVNSVEKLVRTGLNVDYRTLVSEEPLLRGSLHVQPTLRRWTSGRLDIVCEFDELSANTALNRVLRAALERVAHNAAIPSATARRARSLLSWFRAAGVLERSDTQADVTKGERRYRRPLELARSILASTGRSLSEGSATANTFLFRTPDLIEEGVRRMLSEALHPVSVQKRGRVLVPTAERVMPDLELAKPPFTGDVKYKVSTGKWIRPDLAQAVLFAAAYRSPKALVLGFARDPGVQLPPVPVGDIQVVSALWDASGQRSPVESERRLVHAVKRFLPSAGV